MSAGDWKDFYKAALEGHIGVLAHHIAEGVNPDHQHPEIMRTALVASLLEGQPAVARFLLAQGADPHLVSILDGLSPLEAALKTGQHELADQLRAAGARHRSRPFWDRWFSACRVG